MAKVSLVLNNVTFVNEDGKISLELRSRIPQSVFKYYSINKNSNKSMENCTLFFSHAHLLNDVMDGSIARWNFEGYISKYKADTNNEINKKEIVNHLITPFLGKRGTLSLTESWQNELFWAHYSNDRGYCIQLNTFRLKEFLEENYPDNVMLFPISYGDLNSLDFHNHVLYVQNETSVTVDANIPILSSFAEKNSFWNYENEWRFLLRHDNFQHISNPLEIIDEETTKKELDNLNTRNIHIDPDIIEKVILSVYFFNNNRFNKYQIDKNGIETYWFISKGDTLDFLKILMQKYPEKIEQVEITTNPVVERKLLYKVKILDINDEFVVIQREEIEENKIL